MASDLDVRGAAIVGMGLSQAILSALKAKQLRLRLGWHLVVGSTV
jgi:hypothetical protein